MVSYTGTKHVEKIEELKFRMERVEAATQEYLELLKHAQADFINYKRRIEQETGHERHADSSLVAKPGTLALLTTNGSGTLTLEKPTDNLFPP
jgi:rubrerythrin